MELNRENVEFIQNACNPIAVAKTFSEWVIQAYHENRKMEEVINNPFLLGTLGKLCSLFHLDHDGNRAYSYLDKNKCACGNLGCEHCED